MIFKILQAQSAKTGAMYGEGVLEVLDERGGNDRKTAALFNAACRTKKPLWFMQGVGIHTTGENLSGMRFSLVIGPCQARDAVQ